MKASLCLLKHLGSKSTIAAYKPGMAMDVEELIASGVGKEEAWLRVAQDKLADLTAEQTRIEQVVADAYAATAAGQGA